jgi:MerR HTH family regulatory protein
MPTEQLIQVGTLCILHRIEHSFINALHEFGLIEITKKDDELFITESDVGNVERLIRLHHDLHLNIEGVEVITYLLDQLKQQQYEINLLHNRLRFYEPV